MKCCFYSFSFSAYRVECLIGHLNLLPLFVIASYVSAASDTFISTLAVAMLRRQTRTLDEAGSIQWFSSSTSRNDPLGPRHSIRQEPNIHKLALPAFKNMLLRYSGRIRL